MPTPPPLDAPQKKHLASLRKLLSEEDASSVQQGLELLDALGDPALLAVLAEGTTCDDTEGAGRRGRLVHGPEILARVRAKHRDFVAIALLRRLPLAARITALDADLGAGVDLSPFTALRRVKLRANGSVVLRGLASLEHVSIVAHDVVIEGSPALTHAEVEGHAVTLDDAPLLAHATLSGTSVRVARAPRLAQLKATGTGTGTNTLRLAALPALAGVEIASFSGAELDPLPALAQANVVSCAPAVQRALATSAPVRTLLLQGGDLSAWSGAPALEDLKGDWTFTGDVSLPALVRLEGRGRVPRGLPRLRSATVLGTDVYCDDLPALETLEYEHWGVGTLVLRDLPRLVTRGHQACRELCEPSSVVIERVPGLSQLVVRAARDVTLRELPDLTSFACGAVSTTFIRDTTYVRSVVLARLPKLQTAVIGHSGGGPLEVTDVPALSSLTVERPFGDLSALPAVAALTSLTLTRWPLQAIEHPPVGVDLAPLRACRRLTTLDLRGLVVASDSLRTLSGHTGLRTLHVRPVAEWASVAGTLTTLEELCVYACVASSHDLVTGTVDRETLHALIAHPTLVHLKATLDSLPWLGAGAHALEQLRDIVAQCDGPLARTPEPAATVDREAMAEARRILDRDDPASLMTFLAGQGPEVARALCEGTCLDELGCLVVGKRLENATRVGCRYHVAIVVADAAGLLDGVRVLVLREWTDALAAPLRRHAETLRLVCARGKVYLGHDLWVLLGVAPPASALREGAGSDGRAQVWELLGSSDPLRIAEGAARVVAGGWLEEVVRGAAVKTDLWMPRRWSLKLPEGLAKWAPGSSDLRVVLLALLDAAPTGDPAARAVFAGAECVRIDRDTHGMDVGAGLPARTFLRHAADLTTLTCALSDLDVTEGAPCLHTVTELELTGVSGDLSRLLAFTRLETLTLRGERLTLAALAHHPRLRCVTCVGRVEDPAAFATMPALRTIRGGGAFRVDALVAGLPGRALVCGETAEQGAIRFGVVGGAP